MKDRLILSLILAFVISCNAKLSMLLNPNPNIWVKVFLTVQFGMALFIFGTVIVGTWRLRK